MKILIVSSYLPYPLHSGGQVRLYNLIKELSERHEITLVCEIRPNQTDNDIKAVLKLCKKVVTVPHKKQWSMNNLIKSVTSSQSFLLTGHTLPVMQKKIAELLAEETFDLIHVETFYVMQNLPKTTIPVVLVEHNIEYTVYEKFKERAPLPLRPLLALDIAKIRREEESFWKKADALVAVSLEDQKVMEQKGLRPSIVANGVNTKEFSFKPSFTKEKNILFIGDFKWIQNIDSATFIIKEVFPLLKEELHESDSGQARMTVKLWIVGRKIPDLIKSLSHDPHVLFDEKSSARPAAELFQEASVLLAPIRVGGGTSYKIIEAMSSGTPVVTMQMSADAIEAKDKEQIMVGTTAKELADKTLELLENKSTYEKIAKSGRKLIEEKYTWKMIAQKLDEVYKGLAK